MRVNTDKLRHSQETPFLLIDLLMLGLAVSNLAWIIFDVFFASAVVREGLSFVAPDFVAFYSDKIHSNFIVYDLLFVAIFLTEFSIRWVFAIYYKTYHRWFFFPFVHWYDLLGCIPVGSFRWLRLLRVVSIVYRLQKYGIIDISNIYIVRFFVKYTDVLVEELSDRIVVNVLKGVQEEIAVGTPIVEKIVQQVLVPNKPLLIEWIVSRVYDLSDHVYRPKRDVIRQYIDDVISNSIAQDEKVAALEKLPVIGESITSIIEKTVSDIVFNVIDRLACDIGSDETDAWVHELTDIIIARLLESNDKLNEASKDILIDVLEVVKDEVRVQRWKLKEATA